MTASLIGPIPTHQYVWVDTTFTHRATQAVRYQPAIWFGLVSTPGRMWGCTVLLESGAVYRNLPPHALAFSPSPDDGIWSRKDAQTWDCYGTDWSAVAYPYLVGLRCRARARNDDYLGQHLFAVAPVGDAFSAQPEQAKEFHFLQLDNGRLTVQPTDRVVYQDLSFTADPFAFPSGLAAQTQVFRCE